MLAPAQWVIRATLRCRCSILYWCARKDCVRTLIQASGVASIMNIHMSESFEDQQAQYDIFYDLLLEKKAVKSPTILTKSKFLNGLQCPKLLWTRCHAPATIPLPSDRLQHIFETGHQVGELATQRFPGGVRVAEDDFLKNIDDTRALLAAKDPRPVYEAGIQAGRLYARADILSPSPSTPGAWDIIEVKCSTGPKDVYTQDIAFQRYCFEQAGIRIGRCYLMHINNEYVRNGDIDVEGLFTIVDETQRVNSYMVGLPELVKGLLKIIDMPECPRVSIGPCCGKPYTCPMKALCWAFLPPNNVTELRGRKEKAFKYLQSGVEKIEDIPDPEKLADAHAIQYQCAVSGKPWIDQAKIAAFIAGLKYPLYFMDFETIFEALPRFEGTRPYQQVPFQFSVHIQKTPGGALEHVAFLHKSSNDPRPAFVKALKACLGSHGMILAYHMSFEKARIQELGEAFPEYAPWSADINSRTEDLIVPFRNFFYYHPAQHGSASLKKVYPALVGKGYEGMAIADGGQASGEYTRVTYGEGVDPADRDQVYADLEAYCGLDTMAMVDILGKLRATITI